MFQLLLFALHMHHLHPQLCQLVLPARPTRCTSTASRHLIATTGNCRGEHLLTELCRASYCYGAAFLSGGGIGDRVGHPVVKIRDVCPGVNTVTSNTCCHLQPRVCCSPHCQYQHLFPHHHCQTSRDQDL